MEKNTLLKALKSKIIKSSIAFGLTFFLCSNALSYTDQIWLKSPTTIKTVFDVKAHAILRNLYDNQTLIDPEDLIWQKAYLSQERKGLLEQTIVYQYIKDNRVNIEFEKFEQINAKKRLALYFSSKDKQEEVFKKWGLKDIDIDRWIEERILLEKFLQNHPPFQAIITDRKIEQYYLTHKDKRFLNRPFKDVRDLVIEDYKKMYLQVEFKKWLDQEMRRQRWVVHE